jgi:hypothetical protein
VDEQGGSEELLSAVVKTLAMPGYGTIQAPEFDEGMRNAASPIEKKDHDS